MQIVLDNAEVQIGDSGAIKILLFVDKKSGITVQVPLDRLAAVNVGMALAGKVALADSPLAMPGANGGPH